MGRGEEKLPTRKAYEITERPLISTAYTIQFNTLHFINSPNRVFIIIHKITGYLQSIMCEIGIKGN